MRDRLNAPLLLPADLHGDGHDLALCVARKNGGIEAGSDADFLRKGFDK